MEKYIRFNSETNAIDFLEKTLVFFKLAKSDSSYYKWIIISLFSALYGVAVSVSRGTCNSLNTKDITYKNSNGVNRLKEFDKVLEMCQDISFMNKVSGSKALCLSSKQKESINLLKNELRNNFEHFLPNVSWSIEIDLIKSIIPDILDVIRFMVFETNTYGFIDSDIKKKVEGLLSELSIST